MTRTFWILLPLPSPNMMPALVGLGLPTVPVLVTVESVTTARMIENQPSMPLRTELVTVVLSTTSPVLPLAQIPSLALFEISELSTFRLVEVSPLMPSAAEKILTPSMVMLVEKSALMPLLLGTAHTRPSGDRPSGAHM